MLIIFVYYIKSFSHKIKNLKRNAYFPTNKEEVERKFILQKNSLIFKKFITKNVSKTADRIGSKLKFKLK